MPDNPGYDARNPHPKSAAMTGRNKPTWDSELDLVVPEEPSENSESAATKPWHRREKPALDTSWADALGLPQEAQRKIYHKAMARLFGESVEEPMPDTESEPERIGRFELVRSIGVGGMGIVYLARDPDLAREVAIKLLRTRETDEDASKRMRREARAMAKLTHPNVVHIHEVGTHEGQLFLAMEYVNGPTLRDWLKQAPHTWQEIVEIFCAAGRGLLAAHDAGIVHRDFKPENILITQSGLAKVTDFGLARDADQPHASLLIDLTASVDPDVHPTSGLFTEAGTIMGTPSYMAPEQFLAQRADPRSDQFSFCVTLFEALIGQRPFAGDNYAELSDNVISGNRIDLPTTSVPLWVLAAVERGLRPDRENRFASMRELLAALAGDTETPTDLAEVIEHARIDDYARRAAATGLLICAGQLVYSFIDYTRAGSSELFGWLTLTRALSILLAAKAIVWRADTLAGIRRDTALATAGMAASFIAVNVLYTAGGLHSATLINWVWVAVLVLLNYTYPPHRLRVAAWISTLLSLGFVASEYAYILANPRPSGSSIAALVTINVASFLLGRQLYRDRRADVDMLRSMVPARVIQRVRGAMQVEHFPEATVLYADLTGLTRPTTDSAAPDPNTVFAEFETLVRKFGLERIHRNSEGLVVVCGAPTPRPDHSEVVAEFALALVELSEGYALSEHGLSLSIGLARGPVSVTTIGRAHQLYDLWGETANLAQRLRSHSQGSILVSIPVKNALASSYVVKDHGAMWMPDRSQGATAATNKVGRLHSRRAPSPA